MAHRSASTDVDDRPYNRRAAPSRDTADCPRSTATLPAEHLQVVSAVSVYTTPVFHRPDSMTTIHEFKRVRTRLRVHIEAPAEAPVAARRPWPPPPPPHKYTKRVDSSISGVCGRSRWLAAPVDQTPSTSDPEVCAGMLIYTLPRACMCAPSGSTSFLRRMARMVS